ncbi:hypothetical protein N9C75_02115 [Alphaproteobacteria bacterium]|nr:hypothetical protein [Alphaproteobacteria bacterium]
MVTFFNTKVDLSFGVIIFCYIFLFYPSIATAQVSQSDKETLSELTDSFKKLIEIRNRWSDQLEIGSTQLTDACSYISENQRETRTKSQLDDFILIENSQKLKKTNEFESQISSLNLEQKKIKNEQCTNVFSIFGFDNKNKQVCYPIDFAIDFTQKFDNLLKKRSASFDRQISIIIELNELSEAGCLSTSFQDRFYDKLKTYQKELRHSEYLVISDTIRLLKLITKNLEKQQ